MAFKYSKKDFQEEIPEYLELSNNPRQGSILWQGYLFGLVAGGMLSINDYEDILATLPTTVTTSMNDNND
ncbi:hypothetical protein I6E61_03425 [Psychrobacter sp. NZS113]|uniref:hypothetical protein n=1 Tax=Psychrobacter sp. NZS113 TaxID=2792045 RepID=UPI0018CE4650|nr:hypothetical protein [Psychrobacter sp. NZS113]MBH0095434.1 hypothetical protein [Psychrobacter sp. NZS113]